MPRYEVTDPTGNGYWMVTDTKERTGPFPKTIKDDNEQEKTVQTYGGKTYTVAVFTAYCRDAKGEADRLAGRLNALNPPLPPTKRHYMTDINVVDLLSERGEVNIAMFSGKWCPDPQAEARALLARLNG